MLEKYIKVIFSLANVTEVVRVIAIALNVNEKVFLSRVNKSFWDLRIIGYKSTNENKDTLKISRIGEHTGNFGHCFLTVEVCQLSVREISVS
jgi:hypothetical protein